MAAKKRSTSAKRPAKKMHVVYLPVRDSVAPPAAHIPVPAGPGMSPPATGAARIAGSLNYPKVSASFQERANQAAFWEAWVGAVLSRAGLTTVHYPFVVDGGEYHGTTWDLDVSTDSGKRVPLECKALSLSFTRPDDYPFSDALVCSKSSWDKKWPGETATCRDFLMISMVTGSILWLPSGSPVRFGTVTDTTRGHTYGVVKALRSNLLPLFNMIEFIHEEA